MGDIFDMNSMLAGAGEAGEGEEAAEGEEEEEEEANLHTAASDGERMWLQHAACVCDSRVVLVQQCGCCRCCMCMELNEYASL